MPYSKRASLRVVRAFLRALGDPATYRVRSNPGLWLGFASAIPVPVVISTSAAPVWAVLASFAAVAAWAVIVAAVVRAGIHGVDMIHDMTEGARDRDRIHEEKCDDLRGTIATERDARQRLARLQRLAEEDLVLGQLIQQSLVPKDLRRSDLEIALRHRPCAHVGGDYLQAALPRPDLLYLCVGDVAGHGVAAALVVSRIHGFVQSMILDCVRPEPFVESLNHATLRLFKRTSFFMTFAVLRIDLSSRRIEYATAGHPAPLLLRSDGGIDELATPGIALGLASTVFEHGKGAGYATYAAGDALLLYSDGVCEARAADGKLWGEESLRSLFSRLRGATPGFVASEILREAERFRGARAFDDDVSLMVARLGVSSPAIAAPFDDRPEVMTGHSQFGPS